MFPIVTVVQPASLTGTTNGQLPSGLMRSVGMGGLLHHNAARSFEALRAAARAQGFHLTYTWGGTYRSYENQKALFLRRYSTTPTDRHSKVWNGVRYWNHTGAMAAVPGTSNHGWGLAIDLALDRDPSDGLDPNDAVNIAPAIPWLKENAWRFGFSWEVQSEPWHIRYVRGDRIPAAVIDFERHGGVAVPPATEADLPTLREGAKGEAVQHLQSVLRKVQHPGIVVDGRFGPATAAVVRDFQARHGLTIDAVVGPRTWAKLGQVEAALVTAKPAYPVLRVASRGRYVTYAQRVIQRCQPGLAVDGVFGPATAWSLSEWQKCVGLPANGSVVDAQVWAKLIDVGDGFEVSRP